MFENIILGYVIKRLSEPSTYLGLVTLVATNFHLHFDPTFQGTLVQALMDLGAVAAIVLKDGGHVWSTAPVVHDAGTMTTKGLNEEEIARNK